MNKALVEEIQRALDRSKKSVRAASIEATGSPETLRMILSGRVANPRVDTLKGIARALDIQPERLIQLVDAPGDAGSEVRPAAIELPARLAMPQDIPVLGTAVGGVTGSFEFNGEVVDYVRRPPGLANAAGIYAIYISGTSMEPEHRAGDLRIVNPNRPAAIGDTVIIQVARHEGAPPQAFIKHLVKRSPEKIVAAQLNPPATIDFKLQTVVAVHRVMTLAELFGV